MNLEAELGRLMFFFDRGNNAYANYLEHGSRFLHAKILKNNNNNILDVLSKVYAFCPSDIQEDVLRLSYHLDVWKSQWCCLERELNPGVDDKFVFHSAVRYPKDAEKNIVNFFKGLT